MYIVAIAWAYVVLMMSITESSVVAGIMTLLMYGVLPLTIILYVMRAPHRKRQTRQHKQTATEHDSPADASK
nr:hypothetical protein [Herminiimonas sp. CN]